MAVKVKTKSEIVSADIAALLRARNPFIVVVTPEETRIEKYLFEAAAACNYIARTWDVAQGAAEITGDSAGIDGSKEIEVMLEAIKERALRSERDIPERVVWIMRDLSPWLAGYPGLAPTRLLRNLVKMLPGIPPATAQAIIVVSPSKDIPAELANHATVIEWPLPDRAEIGDILDIAVEAGGDAVQKPNGQREAAIDAAVGLSGEEAAACYSKSLVQLRRIDPIVVAQEKKRVIAKSGVLEWMDPLKGGLDSVGGLDVLKTWLMARSAAYTPEARAYGLPKPKGVLLVGVPGCGKTHIGKAIATAWECPLLRLDLGALKSKYVGESEQNLRKVFTVASAVGKAIILIDEIEKSLQGATSGSADGGVSADALGALLSWMQDRESDVFIVATANDISALPPEFVRKGRWDDLFFVDTPTFNERIEILAASLRSHGRAKVKVDAATIARATEGFTGAEIASLVPDAMYAAFADNKREIETGDLITAAKQVSPLTKTAEGRIKALREWAKGKTRPATSPDAGPAKKLARVLDI